MPLKIESKEYSGTKKRVDATVLKTSFWNDDQRFTIRILSGLEMKDPDELLKEVVERIEEWRQGKKTKYLKLEKVNGTAYILSEETI